VERDLGGVIEEDGVVMVRQGEWGRTALRLGNDHALHLK